MKIKIEKTMQNKKDMIPKICLSKYFNEVLKPTFGQIVNSHVIIKNPREIQSF